MIQRRSSLGLSSKAFKRLGIARHRLRPELEGDKSVESGVFCLVNFPHPTRAELLKNVVMGDRLSNH